jgi:hypothetical protein
MKLINIKERIKLTSIEENKTKLDFEIKINIGIPNKDEFEKQEVFSKMSGSIKANASNLQSQSSM